MGRIIISHLGPAQETEIRFLLELCEALRTRGHEPMLWSAIYDPRFAPYYLPLNWRLKKLPDYYADLAPAQLPGVDLEKWRTRVEVLIKQDENGPRDPLFQHLCAMTAQVIDTFRPDLLLAWNSLCPHTGIAFDYNRACGRSSWLIEKAVFPETWFMEPGGLVGHSIYAGTTLETHVRAEALDHFAALGRAYLARTNFAAYNRYAQAERCEAFERATSGAQAERRPRIAFFPPDDGTLGFVPLDHEDRRATLPHYENSFAAAKALSHAHDGITLYKVHPSLAEHPHDTAGHPHLHVVNYDFHKVIAWADIVATTGSGLEFIAMAMGKPVLLLGNDILAGKGIAYEAQAPEALPRAIAAAHAREDFAERTRRFEAYCGWLATEILGSTSDAPLPRRGPKEIAEELSRGYLPATTPVESTFWTERAALLTPHWREKLATDTATAIALRDKPAAPLITNPEDMLAAVAVCKTDLILDFDNTLILDNSTERWLGSVRPKTLAYLICLLSDYLVHFAARRRWCKADRWRDQARVAITTLLFPWNLIWWRATAKGRMATFLNKLLADAVATCGAREVTIVTFGFRHLVAPLIAQLPFKTRLIASAAFSPRANLRKGGKVAALMHALGPDRVKNALFITDSRDDQEVINHAGASALYQWNPYPAPAFARTYLPFRYAVQGKYAGRNYLKTQILQEDLAIWLLAYNWSLVTLPGLFLLFASMYCIYEIGYWENDHVAAKKEAKPTLSKTAHRFADYPIWQQGWLWAIALGIGGIAFSPMLWGWSGAEGIQPYRPPFNPVYWIPMLILLWMAFWAFNRLRVTLRPYIFPILHFIKNFAAALIFPLSPLGALLLLSQLLSQMMVYIAHRAGGNSASFNRQSQRLMIFCLIPIIFAYHPAGLLRALSVLNPSRITQWAEGFYVHGFQTPVYHQENALHLALILLWMTFRILQRAYGRGILAIMGTLLRRQP